MKYLYKKFLSLSRATTRPRLKGKYPSKAWKVPECGLYNCTEPRKYGENTAYPVETRRNPLARCRDFEIFLIKTPVR